MTTALRLAQSFGCALVVLLGLVRVSAAQTGPQVVIIGVVQDQTGAVLRAATVELVTSGGTVAQTKTTDAVGAFKFEAVSPGDYDLRARFPGFKEATRRLRVGRGAPGVQQLVLALADVKMGVTVGSRATQVDTTASNNLNAVSVDQQMLQQLPAVCPARFTTSCGNPIRKPWCRGR